MYTPPWSQTPSMSTVPLIPIDMVRFSDEDGAVRRRTLPLLLLPVLLLAACGSSGSSKSSAPATAKASGPTTVRLGYFPNITHATAIVGVEGGIFAKHL